MRDVSWSVPREVWMNVHFPEMLSAVVRAMLEAMRDEVRPGISTAELDDVGLVRMLSPEQLERKVGAIFGENAANAALRETREEVRRNERR